MRILQRFSADWRLVPLAFIAWLITIFSINQHWHLNLLLLVTLIFILLLIWKHSELRLYLLAMLLIALFFSFNIYALNSTTINHPIYKQAKLGSYITLAGTIIDGNKHRIQVINLLKINGENYVYPQELPNPIIDLKFSESAKEKEFWPGTKIIFSGKLSLDKSRINLLVQDSQIISDGDFLHKNIIQIRKNLKELVNELPWDGKSLIPALVFGDTSMISKTLISDFKHSGLMHLMAVSGANLAILLNFSLAIACRIKIRGYSRIVLTTILTFFFVLFCQFEPSVLRAAAMALVVVPSLSRNNGLRQLSLAVLALLLIYPELALSWGFTLSVSATLGILVLAPRIKSVWQRFLGSFWADFLAVPIAAQLATMPVIVSLSGIISIVSLPANLLAAPVIAPVTISGIILTLLAQFSHAIAYCFAWFPLTAAEIIKAIAQYSVTLPGAYLQMPNSYLYLMVSIVFSVVIYLLLLKLNIFSFYLVTVSLVVSLIFAPWIFPSNDWKITICQLEKSQIFLLANSSNDIAAVIFTENQDLKRDIVACQNKIGKSNFNTIIYNSDTVSLVYPGANMVNIHDYPGKTIFGDFEILNESLLGHNLIYERGSGNSISIYSKTDNATAEELAQDPSQIIVLPKPKIPLHNDKYVISTAKEVESINRNLILLAVGDILKIRFTATRPEFYH